MIAENQPTETSSSHHHHCMDDGGVNMSKRMSTNAQVQEEDSFLTPMLDFRKLLAIVAMLYWFVMTFFIVPAATVATYSLIYPIIFINPSFFNKLSHALCVMVNDHWAATGQFSGLMVTEYGDDVSKISKKRALFMANHLGLIDHFCLMTSFHNKPVVTSNYMWVIYNIWKSTPLGVMWTIHGNFFINGGASKRAGVLELFREHLRKNYWKHEFGWVVMYPEGSRLFLIRKAEKSFCEKNQLEPFKHCAHPRTGAAHSVLDVCGPTDDTYTTSQSGLGAPIEYIIDCTLGYPDGKPPVLMDAMIGEWPTSNSEVSIHYNVHKVLPEWSDEKVFKEWLYQQYEQKDNMLAEYYKTGKFPGQGRPVSFSLARSCFLQLFWMAMYWAHYQVWVKPLIGVVFRSCGF